MHRRNKHQPGELTEEECSHRKYTKVHLNGAPHETVWRALFRYCPGCRGTEPLKKFTEPMKEEAVTGLRDLFALPEQEDTGTDPLGNVAIEGTASG
jgi:hypothetical protein